MSIQLRYFIGANTSDGFRDLSGNVFSHAGRLFILKGGPGTGKSSLMRAIADEAENRGMTVEYYFCSSDASSLDGIYVREADFAVTDGTSPHQRDPVCPGAVDEIINLGDFWDPSGLAASSDRIMELSAVKKDSYGSVGKLLKANGEIVSERNKILSEAFNMEKLDAAVQRTILRFHPSESGKAEPRQVSAIGMNGYTRFPTYEENSDTALSVTDRYGASRFVFQAFEKHLLKNEIRFFETFDPLTDMSVNGLRIPSCSLAIVRQSDSGKRDNIFNTSRFIIPSALRSCRLRLRSYAALSDAIMKEITDIFKKIKETHFTIEKIYIDSMDFRRKEAYTKRLISGIFQ